MTTIVADCPRCGDRVRFAPRGVGLCEGCRGGSSCMHPWRTRMEGTCEQCGTVELPRALPKPPAHIAALPARRWR